MRAWAAVTLGLWVGLFGSACVPEPPEPEPASSWHLIEPGLELGLFPATIRVLRVDPHRFTPELFNASDPRYGEPRTARAWARSMELVAVINAGMYQEDLETSVSLMRSRQHVNNPHLTRHKAVLAFDPLEDDLPPVRLIDLACEEFEPWRERYGSFVQGIRMLSCDGENVWKRREGRWSISTIGVDRDGSLLLIHAEEPIEPRELIDRLVELPLGLTGLIYAEGGVEAQLFVRDGERSRAFLGRFDGLFGAEVKGSAPLPVPNVIGIRRKAADRAESP